MKECNNDFSPVIAILYVIVTWYRDTCEWKPFQKIILLCGPIQSHYFRGSHAEVYHFYAEYINRHTQIKQIHIDLYSHAPFCFWNFRWLKQQQMGKTWFTTTQNLTTFAAVWEFYAAVRPTPTPQSPTQFQSQLKAYATRWIRYDIKMDYHN